MTWVFISPHLDDAAFSCGGLIWDQVSRGETACIWTVCAGEPSARLSEYAERLHSRWETGVQATALRRAEDARACQRLGAGFQHLSFPDAIYRRHPELGNPLYTSDESLFIALPEAESVLVEEIAGVLADHLTPDSQLVCPLALGNHVDHQLVRAAAERLGRALRYYADLPYVLRKGDTPDRLVQRLRKTVLPVSEEGLQAWEEAAGAYTSQISTFWSGVPQMQAELRAYAEKHGGVPLWEPC